MRRDEAMISRERTPNLTPRTVGSTTHEEGQGQGRGEGGPPRPPHPEEEGGGLRKLPKRGKEKKSKAKQDLDGFGNNGTTTGFVRRLYRNVGKVTMYR